MNEQTQSDYTDNNDYEIAVIGAGGIGSHLTSALVPALHRGGLLDSTGGITIRVYDSDTVTEENLAHQRFNHDDVGMHKVAAIERSMRPFTGARRQEPVPALKRGSSSSATTVATAALTASAPPASSSQPIPAAASTPSCSSAEWPAPPWTTMRMRGAGGGAICRHGSALSTAPFAAHERRRGRGAAGNSRADDAQGHPAPAPK